MKRRMMVIIYLFLMAGTILSNPKAPVGSNKKVTLETQRQRISYSVGYHIGLSVKEIANDVDFDVVFQAIKDVAIKGKPQIPEEELKQIMEDFQKRLDQRREENRKRLGEKNKVEGEKFLRENAKKPGVKVCKSGLQYKVIKEGNGPRPTPGDTVRVQYRGTLVDGTEFDSSFKHGQAAKLDIQQLLPGLREALPMMKVGSQYILYIPSDLGYREEGAGDVIGPQAVLIYEMELLGIESRPNAEKK